MATQTKKVYLTLTLEVTKDVANLTDLVAGRCYTMDGVENATATLVQEQGQNYEPAISTLDAKIRAFNKLYGLPAPAIPTISSRDDIKNKLKHFWNIVNEELEEVRDILKQLDDPGTTPEIVLTDIADWLGDIIVYCASELTKYGLAPSDVLGIIMASNMSKLGPDGKPIYDERGKVMKGPGYWKPEPMLLRYIQAAIRQGTPQT
jgi:UDP:flavonoid glycosyltransferase YjiC (YdhE family)